MNIIVASCINEKLIDILCKHTNNKIYVIGNREDNSLKNSKLIFVKKLHDIKYLLKKSKKILFVNDISYIDPSDIKKLFCLSGGSFFSASISGSIELYLMQVMGILPEFLNGKWHDNYITNSLLSETDLKYDFAEKYIHSKNKNKFFFNKIISKENRNILLTNKVNKITSLISKDCNISKLISLFSKTERVYITSHAWYFDNEMKEYSERLYQ